MKCLLAIKKICGLTLVLAASLPAIAAAGTIERTQMGHYDLATQTKQVYNLEVTATPTGSTAIITRPGDSQFLLSSQIVPCFSTRTEHFSEGYIEIKGDKSVGADNYFLPLVSFINDNNLLFSSTPLSATRQLVFMEDNPTLFTFDVSNFNIDSTGCAKR